MMNPGDLQKKIDEYENFIESKLKKDLKDLQQLLKNKADSHKDWSDVKHVVKNLKEFKEKDSDMSVRFDIGNNVMASGEIVEYDTTYVCIGLGYMLEMDCDEAEKYSDIRMKLLKREIDHLRKLVVSVKVHIKMALLAINELQSTLIPNLKQLKIT